MTEKELVEMFSGYDRAGMMSLVRDLSGSAQRQLEAVENQDDRIAFLAELAGLRAGILAIDGAAADRRVPLELLKRLIVDASTVADGDDWPINRFAEALAHIRAAAIHAVSISPEVRR